MYYSTYLYKLMRTSESLIKYSGHYAWSQLHKEVYKTIPEISWVSPSTREEGSAESALGKQYK